jgi:hypothetical protein
MNEVIVETDGCKENDQEVDSVFICGMQARAKHDAVNTATAGCVTGGSMSVRGILLFLLCVSFVFVMD